MARSHCAGGRFRSTFCRLSVHNVSKSLTSAPAIFTVLLSTSWKMFPLEKEVEHKKTDSNQYKVLFWSLQIQRDGRTEQDVNVSVFRSFQLGRPKPQRPFHCVPNLVKFHFWLPESYWLSYLSPLTKGSFVFFYQCFQTICYWIQENATIYPHV